MEERGLIPEQDYDDDEEARYSAVRGSGRYKKQQKSQHKADKKNYRINRHSTPKDEQAGESLEKSSGVSKIQFRGKKPEFTNKVRTTKESPVFTKREK